MKNIRTRRGAIRRYNALIRKAYKQLAGGTSFGIDMPTLSVCCPGIYAEIKRIRAMFSSLPA